MASGGKREGAGKPLGYKAPHTLAIAESRKQLIEMYQARSKEINTVLIALALEGDMQAIKELHDRAYGKSLQTNENINVKKVRFDDEELQKINHDLIRIQKGEVTERARASA